MKEKELTTMESLKLIEKTIEQSRKDVAKASAQPFLVWGTLIIFTSLIIWILGSNIPANEHTNKWHLLWILMAFIGGICVSVPLCYFIKKYNIGLIGLSFVCGIDRIVRATYLRLYIKFNKPKLFV